MRDVRLLLLGPVRLISAGEPVPVGPASLQLLMAALAVDAGRPVAVAVLTDRVFGGDRPPVAKELIAAQVEMLRRLIERDGSWEVRRGPGGYALLGEPGTVDLERFQILVDAAGSDGVDEADRADILEEALRLWRGPALADLAGPWAEQTRADLQRRRHDALAQWARARIALGATSVVIGPVQDAINRDPSNEDLAAVLAEATVRTGPAGRTAPDQAGAAGPDLTGARHAIATPPPAPAQLPMAVPGFIGRVGELAALDALVDGDPSVEGTGTVAAIWGPPGVGKTVLAIGWAHRVAPRFPDGQLYLDLRGFDSEGNALDPAAAVRSLLHGLGVPPEQIPGGVDDQLALYRSVLAGRRVLLVLDNAVTAEQVRPLLPGAPDCRTVVTSRAELTSLVSRDGARPLTLSVFTADEARRMLALRLGATRVHDEAAGVSAMVDRCAGLPLALAIAASYAASHPNHPLQSLMDSSREDLDLFADSDPATDLRAVFSWSYRGLSSTAARLFRLVGVHSGPDVTVAASANLAGLSLAEVRPILWELSRASMLTEHLPGRFHAHALLRAYAVELAAVHDPAGDRQAAVRRLLDYYLGTAVSAAMVLFPQLAPMDVPEPGPGVTTASIVDADAAVGWFAAEWEGVVAATSLAAEHGLATHAWQLTMAVSNYVDRRGLHRELLIASQIALAAVRDAEDPSAVGRMHRAVAICLLRLGRHEEGAIHLRQALALYGSTGNQLHRAAAHNTLAILLEELGELREALAEAVLALEIYRAIDDRLGEANVLNSIAWTHTRLGGGEPEHSYRRQAEFELAESYSRQALAAFDRADRHDLAGRASAWHTVGFALHHQGECAEAVTAYRESLRHFREGGIRLSAARVLVDLGDTHMALAEATLAGEAWAEALEIFRDVDHPDTALARARLDQLEPGSADQPHRSPLTPRETEVARCVGQGLTNKQIARRLDISEWTVVNHMREIMRKLDCTSRVQVARWAWDALDPEESSA
jgi:DNA-binding CsgD family transcriptional regulator/tetratricopeptide (TPR) repeat protein/DNA-binding SARP family transcriptional activator